MTEQKASLPIFHFNLVFQEQVNINKAQLLTALEECFGQVSILEEEQDKYIFALQKYSMLYQGQELAPMLALFPPLEKSLEFSPEEIVQWEFTGNLSELLNTPTYTLATSEFLSRSADPLLRLEIMMEYLVVLLNLFPQCVAVYFPASERLIAPEIILAKDLSPRVRFLTKFVNIRYYQVEGSEDFIVDSLGMYTIDRPDIQYHYQSLEFPSIHFHAISMLDYLLENVSKIESGHTVPGAKDLDFDYEQAWTMSFEDSLTDPDRMVLDIKPA